MFLKIGLGTLFSVFFIHELNYFCIFKKFNNVNIIVNYFFELIK